jgi:hypothetical protein
MHKMSRGKATHSDRLVRWLGAEQVDYLSRTFKGFYWPIALHGVPGKVFIMPGGDFCGEIKAGSFLTKEDGAAMVLKKLRYAAEKKVKEFKALGILLDMIKADDKRLASIGAFASVDAVIAAYTGGKGQQIIFSKTGTTGTVGGSRDLWITAGQPAAGAIGAAAAAGTAHTASDTGALGYKNLGAAASGHYLNWVLSASVISNSLLLYDRLFSVAAGNALNTGAEIAVTGVPTRYQSTTEGADNYIGGNFAFPGTITTLGATAHTWDAGGGAGVGMQYKDQADAASNMPVSTGVSGSTAGSIDQAIGAGSWFAPLAAGDVGIKALTNMSANTSVTGTLNWVIGHPIAVNACPIANLACLDDGVYTAINLTHIEDNACLAFIELPKPATTATTYSGVVRTVSE